MSHRVLATAGCLLIVSGAVAIDWTVKLSDEQLEGLPEQARGLYLDAMKEIDHVNYDGGVTLLGEAAEQAPKNVDLQFFTVARARDRAEVYYSAASYSPLAYDNMTYSTPPWRTSEVFFDVADSSLRRLLENSDLNTEEKMRLRKEVKAVGDAQSGMTERDKARFEAAASLVREILMARMEAFGLAELEGEPETALDLALDQGGTDMPGGLAESLANLNPFDLLPGEHLEDFLPPPPPPPQQQGAYGQGFGDPYSPGFGADPYGVPAGPGLDPANPYGAAPGAPMPGAAPAPAPENPFGPPMK